MKFLSTGWAVRKGAAASEYMILLTLIGLLAVASVLSLGDRISRVFGETQAALGVSLASSISIGNGAGADPEENEEGVSHVSIDEALTINVVFLVDETSAAFVDNEPLGWSPMLQDDHESAGQGDGIANFADNMRQLMHLATYHFQDAEQYPGLVRLRTGAISMGENSASHVVTKDNLIPVAPFAANVYSAMGEVELSGTINYDDGLDEVEAWFSANEGADLDTYNVVYVLSASEAVGSGFASRAESLRAQYDADIRAVGFFDDSHPAAAAAAAMSDLDLIDNDVAMRISSFEEALNFVAATLPSAVLDAHLASAVGG